MTMNLPITVITTKGIVKTLHLKIHISTITHYLHYFDNEIKAYAYKLQTSKTKEMQHRAEQQRAG